MTFFNFSSDSGGHVSSQFWIYWIVTIPLTLVVIACWWGWERWREKQHAKEDEDLEKAVDGMELEIMSMMRKRTMSKVATFDKNGTVGTGTGTGAVTPMPNGTAIAAVKAAAAKGRAKVKIDG